MRQDLPPDVQRHILSYLVRPQRILSQRLPKQEFPSYAQNMHRTHCAKQHMVASIPIYPLLLETARSYLQMPPTHPPPRVMETDVFGQDNVDTLRQHTHSKKVFVGIHIRYFEYKICFLVRDLDHLYVLIYQPIDDDELLDVYLHGTTPEFHQNVWKAFRKRLLKFLYAYQCDV